MIQRIIHLFISLWGRKISKNAQAKKDTPLPSKRLYKKFYAFTNVDEVPDHIKDNVIYHVGEGNFKWLLVFKCPCGCQEVIQLNLLKDAKPVWRVKFHDDGDISIYPSVNRQVNCKSHFNITRNNVRWWEWTEGWR